LCCLRSNLLLFLVRLVQQHRGEFFIAHAVNTTILIADQKLRINLRHLLGNCNGHKWKQWDTYLVHLS
jgi:hypothetical protein